MALAECNSITDENGRELLEHGSPGFPIACYHDDFHICDVSWHWHEEWEAVLITQGSCLIAAGNQKIMLRAGEGFFIQSGVLHGCWDAEHTGCRFHSIVFHPRLVGSGLDSIFHQQFVQPLLDHTGADMVVLKPDILWQKQALIAIEAAWQHCVREEDGFPFLVRNQLSQLIFLLNTHLSPAASAISDKQFRDAQRIKTMLSFIHTGYGGELDTAMIAASASVSESECLRCFRGTIGTTPIQYLKTYRIRQAEKLLLSTDRKVSDIAECCGYQDMSYFTRSFRELTGCTPTQYRKNASP